jgi:heptosyltransferase I
MRIAIVRLSALGDIINSAFILPFIKEQYPQSSIDWICEEVFAPILANNPYLDNIHTVSLKKDRSISGIKKTIKKLKNLAPYDMVLDLQGLIKSSLVAKYLGPVRYGFDKHSIREPLASWFYQHKTSIPYSENSLYRTAYICNDVFKTAITKQMLGELQPSLYYEENDNVKPLLKADNNIIFIVGSSQPYKNYPVENIIEAIQLLGCHTILIWGSIQEKEAAQKIHDVCSNTTLAPRLAFNDLIQIIDKSDLVIGNDTGPTHIAWAMKKKSITLFGATPASKMMWQTDINIAIESESEINTLKINKSDFSIADIPAHEVVTLAQRLLNV